MRVRDEFLTVASHDLRSPLTNILGRIDLLDMRLVNQKPLDATWARTQLAALRGAAWRMLSTVQEITDAVQLQIGQPLTLHAAAVDVGAMVRAVVGESSARQDTSEVIVEAPEGLVVQGDRARLERVVQNILDNAIKYSLERTPVNVTVSAHETWAIITVRDSGVGIPAAELPQIFTHFYRASTAIGVKGTGIGLAGAKTIVEQHGGHISIESAVGAGSTVTVHLPRQA